MFIKWDGKAALHLDRVSRYMETVHPKVHGPLSGEDILSMYTAAQVSAVFGVGNGP